MVKQNDGWWIGWLLDLASVNAQDRILSRIAEPTEGRRGGRR